MHPRLMDLMLLPCLSKNNVCSVEIEGGKALHEALVTGNVENQQMSDQSLCTELVTNSMTSKVTNWSNARGYNMSFTNVNMDPSVAIASSGRWANASVYGPSKNMARF